MPKREGLQEDAEVKPLVKHILSKEMQSYYDTIIADLLSSDSAKVKAALYSLSSDSGLQQLLPYFVQFVAEMVPKNLKNLPILQTLTGMIAHLITNEHLFIEPYVIHSLVPFTDQLIAIFSCIKSCHPFWHVYWESVCVRIPRRKITGH